jgi:hypothetical protein
MKYILLLSIGTLVSAASAADLVIQSLDRNGQLTWTNSVSNATYRVEWAGSLSGPWRDFRELTNLSSFAASNTSVTVTVPMFYRVVWTDAPAPQPAGTWLFNGYDSFGSLAVTGRLSQAVSAFATNTFQGDWAFGSIKDGTNGPALCWSGGAAASLWRFELSVSLDGCGLAEGAYWLEGTLLGDVYSGTWYSSGIVLNPVGRFVARRESK